VPDQSDLQLETAILATPVTEILGESTPAKAGRSSLRRSPMRGRLLPAIIGIVGAGIVWEIISAVNPHLLPTGPSVWGELFSNPMMYLRNAGSTLEVTLVGFTASFLISFVIAVIMVHLPVFERILMPLIVILKVTPGIAIAPALVVAFGFGMGPKYIVAGLMVFFQLLVSILMGMRSVDPQSMDVAKTLNASKLDVLLRLRLPYSLPFIFAAVKVCLPISVIGAVVAEFSSAGTQRGLGSAIQLAAAMGDLPQVYACILCLAILGLSLSWIVTRAEKLLLSWHPSSIH
jgi:NitT/TauT family transport system permease protein